MRILFVSRAIPAPEHFGDRQILRSLVAALRSRGHVCDMIAVASASDEQYVADAQARCDWLQVVGDVSRTPLHFVRRLCTGTPRRADRCWNPALWRAVDERMRTASYDVVHVFGGIQVYEVAALVQQRPSIIVPYESHARLAQTMQADARTAGEWILSGVERMVARLFERVMFNGYSNVVVLTAPDRDALLAASPRLPVRVVPSGVRIPLLPAAARERHLLIFVGNFAYRPNVRAAIALATDILPRVRGRVPDARLQLVGASPPAEVARLAGDAVEVTGLVPDTAPFLQRAGCFVAPLTQGTGLKNKVLEAMAAGVPVVTTPIGIDGIAARDGIEAVVRHDTAALSDAVIDIIESPDRGRVIASAARALVERDHSWDGVAAQYEQIYEHAVASWQASQR